MEFLTWSLHDLFGVVGKLCRLDVVSIVRFRRGLLRIPLLENKKCLGLVVYRFLGFLVSKCLVSKFQTFLVSRFHNFG